MEDKKTNYTAKQLSMRKKLAKTIIKSSDIGIIDLTKLIKPIK